VSSLQIRYTNIIAKYELCFQNQITQQVQRRTNFFCIHTKIIDFYALFFAEVKASDLQIGHSFFINNQFVMQST